MGVSRRRLLVAGTTAILTIGAVASATPAVAGSWSGSITCPASIFVKATGAKGGTGPITVSAQGHSYTDTTKATGFSITVVGASSAGSWSVSGSGATSGVGYCGT